MVRIKKNNDIKSVLPVSNLCAQCDEHKEKTESRSHKASSQKPSYVDFFPLCLS